MRYRRKSFRRRGGVRRRTFRRGKRYRSYGVVRGGIRL